MAIATETPARSEVINPAVVYTSASSAGSDDRPFTVGYRFQLDAPVRVDELGVWNDPIARGYSHEAGIWNSTGKLITSTTVYHSDPVFENFIWRAIPQITLTPGIYTIGEQSYEGGFLYFIVSPTAVKTIPEYSYITDEQFPGFGLNLPTITTGGAYGENGILMVNFSASRVPEPSTWTMTLAGFAALSFWRYRSSRGS
jgi:hypothetical protein